VYNTLRQGESHNDVMPDLRELPDRAGRIKNGVTSDQLIGKTVDWFGKFRIIEKGKSDWKADPAVVTIKDWVEMQLPPRASPATRMPAPAASRPAYKKMLREVSFQYL
jgi:manganese oxidase